MERSRFASNKTTIENEAQGVKALLETIVRPEDPQAIENFLRHSNPAHYSKLYRSQEDEEGFQTVEYDSRDAMTKWLHPKSWRSNLVGKESSMITRHIDLPQHVNVWNMSLRKR
jgi:hypothetical protein